VAKANRPQSLMASLPLKYSNFLMSSHRQTPSLDG